MAVNGRKILTGGLLAGFVIIIVNVFAQLLVSDRVRSEMNDWLPGSSERMTMGGVTLAVGVVLKFVLGIMLVWLYTAIRPRFGPGLRTASYAAIFVWVLGGIFFSDYLMMGMISSFTYIIVEILQLVGLLIATWVGARVYSE